MRRSFATAAIVLVATAALASNAYGSREAGRQGRPPPFTSPAQLYSGVGGPGDEKAHCRR
jgi:hypothetical protein